MLRIVLRRCLLVVQAAEQVGYTLWLLNEAAHENLLVLAVQKAYGEGSLSWPTDLQVSGSANGTAVGSRRAVGNDHGAIGPLPSKPLQNGVPCC